MFRIPCIVILMLICCSSSFAFDPLKGKPYHFSLQTTNPLSGSSKYGGVVEYRFGRAAITLGITNYIGAYQGVQFKFEFIKYINTIYRNETFWYMKGISGNAQYESSKLSMLGEDRDFTIGPVDYSGVGAGFGRRWNFNHLCIVMNAGLKYALLPDSFSDENKEYFRYFYATGPGSIIDLNFRFGYQF